MIAYEQKTSNDLNEFIQATNIKDSSVDFNYDSNLNIDVNYAISNYSYIFDYFHLNQEWLDNSAWTKTSLLEVSILLKQNDLTPSIYDNLTLTLIKPIETNLTATDINLINDAIKVSDFSTNLTTSEVSDLNTLNDKSINFSDITLNATKKLYEYE